MNFRRNLRRNNSGIGTVFGMIFFLLIVMIVFASFVILLNQNTSLEQTTIQAKQLDLDRYTELTTVSISDPEIAVLNHVVYVGCSIMNNGTLPTQLVRLWIKDITQNTVDNVIITPSITLQPGHSIAYFNSAYVNDASFSDQMAFWFITARGNTISAYPSTNQLNNIISSGAFPGVTDINSTYTGEIYHPLQLSLTTTKPNQLIYVVVSYDDENTLYTPTSTPSLTWTKRSQSLDTDYGYFMDGDSTLETYYAIKPTIGPLTINVESTADHLNDYYCSALAFAISDVNTTAPFDDLAQTTVAKSTMPQEMITTHYSKELIIGSLSIDSLNPLIIPGAGFAEIMPVQSSYGATGEPNALPRSVWSEWAIIDTPTTNLPVNCTFTSPKNWAIIVDAVRLVAIPPTTPVSLSPNSGPIGQSITVSGNGFAANSPLLALFDGLPIPFSTTTDSTGAIPSNAKFTVPLGSTAGNKTVTIVDRSFNYANTTFLVTTPSMAVSPTIGSIGTVVTVTGSNFVDNSTVNINFDGNPTVTTPSSIVADASGSFSATFIFSSNATAGIKQIIASDGFNSAFANFAVTPSITLNPTNGPVGSLVNVSGMGFAAIQPVTIKFDGATVVTIPVNLTSDSFGFFSASFTIPTGQTAGGKNVNASDTTLNSATSTFAITPSISLSPTSGNIGSSVTVSGSGFASNSALIAKFAGSTVTLSGTVNTNSSGGFAGVTFTVPTWVPTWATGSIQIVNITDASSNSGSSTYTVNTVSQTITVAISNSPSSAAVTVNGGNAIPNTFAANGNSNSVTMFAGASFTLSFSNSGNIRNGFSLVGAFSSTSSSFTASTTPISVTAYDQVQNTFSVPGVSGIGSVVLTGTYLGTGSSSIVTLNSGNAWSTQGWSDNNTSVAFPALADNSGSSERWAIGSAYTTGALTAGGNTYSQTYDHQFKLTFAQSGLDNSATGTVITVSGSAYSTLPYTTAWINSGSTITYTYNNPVTSSATGQQFRLTSVTGSVSPIIVNNPATITGNYVVQWRVTFSQTGVDNSAGSNTVLTVGSTNYAYNALPSSVYVDSGTSYSWASPVSGGSGRQFVLTSSPGASTISATGTYSAIYKTQYFQTVTSSPATGSGYISVDSVAQATPYQVWWDSGSSHTIAASSTVIIVAGQSQSQYLGWSDAGAQSHTVSPTAIMTYTVNFQPQYYFAVSSTYDSPTGAGWYNAGSTISSTVTTPVSGGTGIRYLTTGWTGTGSLSSGGSAGSSSTGSFTINAYSTCTWNWKTQYQVTFAQSGIESSATGTVLTVDSTTYTSSQLPQTGLWVDSGTAYTYSTSVQTGAGKIFGYTSVTGLTSPITESGMVTGKYGSLILRPNAAGTTTGLSVNTGANYVAVDDSTSDNDATYVYRIGTTPQADTYNIPDTTLTGLTIQRITIHIVGKEESNSYDGHARGYLRIGGTNYNYASYTDLTTTYNEYTYAWTTNPNSGASWSWANINSLEIGVQMYGGHQSFWPYNDYYARCTQVWVEITYTA